MKRDRDIVKLILLTVILLSQIPFAFMIFSRIKTGAAVVPGAVFVEDKSTPFKAAFETNTVISVSNGWVHFSFQGNDSPYAIEMDARLRSFAICMEGAKQIK